MTLHENGDLFEELIIAASASLGIPEVFVEKDYWVSSILQKLSKLDEAKKVKVIFKGGTSLSKAHKLIERFSEDIDLAIIVEGLSDGQAKSFIKTIEREILPSSLVPMPHHPQVSKGSKFRKTVHGYPRRISGDMGDAKEVILLELNSYTDPTPNSPRQISSYVCDFLMSRDEHELIEEYGLAAFEVNVLDMERTLCEKISAVSRASYDSIPELQSKIRHLYDIFLLLEQPEIRAFFESPDFAALIATVKANDANFQPQNIEPPKPLKDAPIFQDRNEVLSQIKGYYHGIFSDLVHGELPAFENIESTVKMVAARLEEIGE